VAKKIDDNKYLDDWDKSKGWQTGNKNSWQTKRCYETHPALKIGEHFVFGGSCSSPVVEDADIYIGLDYSMKDHEQRLPWVEGHAIHYRITDMQAPANPAEFKQLIEWLAGRIESGDKAHIGCIGGHGRTGTVLAALVAVMQPDIADAIKYVRDNYCKKAVEANVQIEFLRKHFGIKTECKASKGGWAKTGSKKVVSMTRNTVSPVQAKFCLWGDEIKPEDY
jgi:protein-tyrosine phosphatase